MPEYEPLNRSVFWPNEAKFDSALWVPKAGAAKRTSATKVVVPCGSTGNCNVGTAFKEADLAAVMREGDFGTLSSSVGTSPGIQIAARGSAIERTNRCRQDTMPESAFRVLSWAYQSDTNARTGERWDFSPSTADPVAFEHGHHRRRRRSRHHYRRGWHWQPDPVTDSDDDDTDGEFEQSGVPKDTMVLAFKIPDAPFSDSAFSLVHGAVDAVEAVHTTLGLFGVELAGLLGVSVEVLGTLAMAALPFLAIGASGCSGARNWREQKR